ncbi:glycoside hydrolase family 104 protein [Acinetobacter baumannii]
MADPRQYLNDPRVRKVLDVIASAEGVRHGYNTIFGNERFGNLSTHPNVRKQFRQTDGRTNFTTAAGRYQFLKDTWDGLSRQYGLKDFSPQSQDIGAIGLIMQKGALNDVLKGNYQAAIQKLGGTWASLPSSPYAQPKRSQAEVDRFLGGASSQSQQSYKSKYVDLNALRKKHQPQQQYVDLNALREQSQQQQQHVDLNALRQNTQSQYVDLNALRGQQQDMLTQD